MTEKRYNFNVNKSQIEKNGYYFALCNIVDAQKIVRELNEKDRQIKVEKFRVNALAEENEKLKKEIHLMHMRSMFSTVKSFKGNVSERYVYSEETDNIYDTANHYGQYHKILTKKEIVMLLNEYETIIKELKEVKK